MKTYFLYMFFRLIAYALITISFNRQHISLWYVLILFSFMEIYFAINFKIKK